MAGDAVILGSQLNARNIAYTHDSSLGSFPNHDLLKFFRRHEAPLCAHCISERLPGGAGSLPTCPAGFTVFCVWIALMISGTVICSFRELIRVLPRAAWRIARTRKSGLRQCP